MKGYALFSQAYRYGTKTFKLVISIDKSTFILQFLIKYYTFREKMNVILSDNVIIIFERKRTGI